MLKVGHSVSEDHSNCADSDGGQISSDAHANPATIATLRELRPIRVAHHKAEKSLTLQIKAQCRRIVGGDLKDADALYKALMGKGEHDLAAHAIAACSSFVEARAVVEKRRAETEKEIEKAAKKLGLGWFVAGVPGFNVLSLGQLIGETGDLNNYATVSRVWKRMGLAVIAGGRQRRVAGVDALEHGYNPERRSLMWVIGDCLIKSGGGRTDAETGEIKKQPSPYYSAYLAEKARQAELHPELTKAHAHNRAKRKIEKQLLADLWSAWRNGGKP